MKPNARPFRILPTWNSILFAIFFQTLVGILLSGCGNSGVLTRGGSLEEALPPIGAPAEDGIIVKARAVLVVSSDANRAALAAAPMPVASTLATGPSEAIDIEVSNAASVSMSVDTSEWTVPKISNTMLDFGALAISALSDNNLKACGPNGKTKCGTALVRVYTVGQPGAGLWNAVDGYGMPIFADLGNTDGTTVGLGASNAAIVQSVAIGGGKNVFRLSDFPTPPRYPIRSDFTEAGAGSYATTLVIEYALAP